VHSDKKSWAKPAVRPVDRSAFASWDRDKLVRVRDLVQHALKLIEQDDQVSDVPAMLSDALDDIEVALRQ